MVRREKGDEKSLDLLCSEVWVMRWLYEVHSFRPVNVMESISLSSQEHKISKLT